VGPGGVGLGWPTGQGLGTGKGSGPMDGLNPELGQNSIRNSFKFQFILEFGRTLENCTRRFRWKFDMGIFPKIF
jgi:hypothetical protein